MGSPPQMDPEASSGPLSLRLRLSALESEGLSSPRQSCGCSGHPHRDVALDRQKSGSQEARLDPGTAGSCGKTFPGPQCEVAEAREVT